MIFSVSADFGQKESPVGVHICDGGHAKSSGRQVSDVPSKPGEMTDAVEFAQQLVVETRLAWPHRLLLRGVPQTSATHSWSADSAMALDSLAEVDAEHAPQRCREVHLARAECADRSRP